MLIKIILICASLFILSGCFEFGKTTDLGDGFEFGYFDNNKSTSNVFYNSSGIIQGVCNSVAWNDKFILATYQIDNSEEIYLIDKRTYILNPTQSESNGVKGPLTRDSLDLIFKTLHFDKRKSLEMTE